MKQIISAILVIIVIVGFVVISFTLQQVDQEKNSLTLDLQHRSTLLTDNIKDRLESAFVSNTQQSIPQIVENFMSKQRLAGIAVFDNKDMLIASSSQFPKVQKDSKTLAA